MGIFSCRKRKPQHEEVSLEEARAEAKKAKQQLEQAKARRPAVEAEIHYQRRVREENGLAEILEGIFTTKEQR